MEPHLNPGDLVIEVGGIADSSACVSAAICAAILAIMARKPWFFIIGYCLSAALVGLIIGIFLGSFWRHGANVTVVKAGPDAFGVIIVPGLLGGIVSAAVCGASSFFVLGNLEPMPVAFCAAKVGFLVGIGMALLSANS